MDSISLIVGALTAGAADGLSDTASTAISDAYRSLWELVRRRLAGRPTAETALSEHETAPEVWATRLAAELERAGIGTDEATISAAQRVIALMNQWSTASGKYTVDVTEAQGVQIGDGSTQFNSFTTSLPTM